MSSQSSKLKLQLDERKKKKKKKTTLEELIQESDFPKIPRKTQYMSQHAKVKSVIRQKTEEEQEEKEEQEEEKEEEQEEEQEEEEKEVRYYKNFLMCVLKKRK